MTPRNAERVVPVTMGAPRFRSVATGGLRVTEAEFAARDLLPMHRHETAILAVMLDGGFELSLRTRAFPCGAGTVSVEPGGDAHANTIGGAGARVMILEVPSDTLPTLGRRCARLLDAPAAFTRPAAAALAWRLRDEMRGRDAVSPLAVEALALELLAEAAHGVADAMPQGRRPGWLARVRDMLDEQLDAPVRVTDLSREVGVHRVHLGRAFRQQFGVSLGEYHRRARIAWAAAQLAGGDEPASNIALRAGFADASHFTRVFKRVLGMPPSTYRALRRHQA